MTTLLKFRVEWAKYSPLCLVQLVFMTRKDKATPNSFRWFAGTRFEKATLYFLGRKRNAACKTGDRMERWVGGCSERPFDKRVWQECHVRGRGGGGWTTICADVSTVIILNLFSTRSVAAATCQLLYPDSWSNTCQLLCHSLSSLYQPPSDPLINLVSSRLTGRASLPIRPVPTSLMSIVPARQNPSRFWRRRKSRPEC